MVRLAVVSSYVILTSLAAGSGVYRRVARPAVSEKGENPNCTSWRDKAWPGANESVKDWSEDGAIESLGIVG